MDIWLARCGVIILQVFHNTSNSEAFTREAAMIDAIGMIILIVAIKFIIVNPVMCTYNSMA